MAGNRSRFSVIGAAVGLGCLAAVVYLSYELGRYQAGYSLLDVRRDSAERQALIETQAREIEDLGRQIAILETAREVDRETYAQVEADLKELEQQIQTQQEELAFYQGIVSPEDGASGLKIQDFSVAPGDAARNYTIQLVLVQAIVHSQRVTGSVRLAVSGRREGGERVALDLPSLGGSDGVVAVPYGFRYFQALGFDIMLPPGFSAESVEVEVQPAQPSSPPIVERYAWPL